MDVRRLRYFLSVVQRGSVGAAAVAHHVTQPAVSVQLRLLEEEVGEVLFERRGRRLVPTPTGRVLAGHAEEVVRRLDALVASMQEIRGLEAGRLRLGNTDAAAIYILPELYTDFHRQHPGVRVEVVVSDTTRLLAALDAGEIELATATMPVESGRAGPRAYATRPIHRETLVPVAHRSHPLAARRRVTLAHLCDAGIISYPAGSTTRRLIEAVFAAADAPYRATMELSSPEAIERLTEAGLGVSILPRSVVTPALKRKALVALAVPRAARFEREIGMVYRDRTALSPAARAFLEMMEARFPGVAEPA